MQDAMRPLTTVARPDRDLATLWQAMLSSHYHGLPVVDADGKLMGIVTAMDLEGLGEGDGSRPITAMDVATRDVLVAYLEEPVSEAWRRMGARDVGQLPVVDEDDDGRVVGLLGREGVIRAYSKAVLNRVKPGPSADMTHLGRLAGTQPVRMEVAPGSPADGLTVAELQLPDGCILVHVVRDGAPLIPRPSLRLLAGDRVTALSRSESRWALERAFGQEGS